MAASYRGGSAFGNSNCSKVKREDGTGQEHQLSGSALVKTCNIDVDQRSSPEVNRRLQLVRLHGYAAAYTRQLPCVLN